MAHTAQIQTIENQIANYVSNLSDKSKKAVLTVVKNISEAEEKLEFERKWAKAMTVEEARKRTLAFIDTLNMPKSAYLNNL